MKIVDIDLALGLKLVEEVEKTKGEGSAGAVPGGRKPAYAKELSTTTAGSLSLTLGTETVDDPDRVDTGSVE